MGGGWRRQRPLLLDLLLVAVIGTVQVAVYAAGDAPPALAVAVALEPLPLLLRRAYPLLTVTIVSVLDVALILVGAQSAAVGPSIVVAAYSAGAHQPRRRAVVSLGVALSALLVVGAVPAAGLTVIDVVGALLVAATAWWIGASLRERRYYAAELEQRTRALEAARLELAERAVAAERLRLARELHDVVAHSLAIIALHSSVGAHNAAARPQDAAAALDAINTATRSALGELRAVLSVLRGPEWTENAPLPSLRDLTPLTDQAERAGVTVRLSVSGDPETVPRAVSLSAFRIIQEALTNVVKHAGPVEAEVGVEITPGRVAVTVANRAGPRRSTVDSGTGSGLAGIRERVGAFAGAFTAHPTTDGGWVVTATLPFEETS